MASAFEIFNQRYATALSLVGSIEKPAPKQPRNTGLSIQRAPGTPITREVAYVTPKRDGRRREEGGPSVGGKVLLIVRHLTEDSVMSPCGLLVPDPRGAVGFQMSASDPNVMHVQYNRENPKPNDDQPAHEHFDLPADAPEAAEHLKIVSALIDERLLAIRSMVFDSATYYQAFPLTTDSTV